MVQTVTNPTNPTLALFEQTGAYLHGHFRLTSGLHSPEYLQCALVLQHPHHAEQLGEQLAKAVHALVPGEPIDAVVAPAMGGLIIGHEVARALECRSLFTERNAQGKMELRRGFVLAPGERVVVIEDVVTTGGSSREVVGLLRQAGAEVVAAGSIIDRSDGTADLGVQRVALATLGAKAYPIDFCPLCADGVPVTKPGSRPV